MNHIFFTNGDLSLVIIGSTICIGSTIYIYKVINSKFNNITNYVDQYMNRVNSNLERITDEMNSVNLTINSVKRYIPQQSSNFQQISLKLFTHYITRIMDIYIDKIDDTDKQKPKCPFELYHNCQDCSKLNKDLPSTPVNTPRDPNELNFTVHNDIPHTNDIVKNFTKKNKKRKYNNNTMTDILNSTFEVCSDKKKEQPTPMEINDDDITKKKTTDGYISSHDSDDEVVKV